MVVVSCEVFKWDGYETYELMIDVLSRMEFIHGLRLSSNEILSNQKLKSAICDTWNMISMINLVSLKNNTSTKHILYRLTVPNTCGYHNVFCQCFLSSNIHKKIIKYLLFLKKEEIPYQSLILFVLIFWLFPELIGFKASAASLLCCIIACYRIRWFYSLESHIDEITSIATKGNFPTLGFLFHHRSST